ncbi:malonyl-coenzyme:anthocyanin 5-O-glucoside-6'''-O-malonyltransferase-like [Tasmannia lanceolata]|uniref:malonyl-coenzyme:anthocyanin 5-O-glucoside-6'''-O-malonyltransferase-like n=1 Tax=Tasmannia lanceolata TaxID=3420 RepID=UPI00406449B9
MAPPHKVQILEQTRVSPPLNSVPDASITLTYFDILWLQLNPVQVLFFYDHPLPTTQFRQTILPNLKNSLSLSLQLFYPLAGNLTLSQQTGNHEISYINGDSVSLIIAESDSDFYRLTANHARDVTEFHTLLPPLRSPSDAGKNPVLALQVTLFPDAGFSIGMSIHHTAADGSSITHFRKSWASICRSGGDLSVITSPPIIDRTVAKRFEQIQRNYFIEMEKINVKDRVKEFEVKKTDDQEVVRATFVLARSDIERLRQWVLARVEKPYRYSSFVLTYAYVWVCLVKLRKVVGERKVHVAFAVDCRARLDPPIPSAYFGNCVIGFFAELKASELGGENGLVVGSEAIRKAIQGMNEDVLKDAELCIPKLLSLSGELVLSVAGSPRFRAYDTDFGWGGPKKIEVISIEGTGAMSLAETRDEEGGVEVGLALPKHEHVDFASIFEEGLRVFK